MEAENRGGKMSAWKIPGPSFQLLNSITSGNKKGLYYCPKEMGVLFLGAKASRNNTPALCQRRQDVLILNSR